MSLQLCWGFEVKPWTEVAGEEALFQILYQDYEGTAGVMMGRVVNGTEGTDGVEWSMSGPFVGSDFRLECRQHGVANLDVPKFDAQLVVTPVAIPEELAAEGGAA